MADHSTDAVLDSLRDIGPGLRQLARAVEQAPAAAGNEVRAVQQQYHVALACALIVGLLLGVVIGRLAGRCRT